MAGQTIINLGTAGSTLNGQSGSTSGADSNDPKFLEHTGTNYVYMPGAANNSLSIPDAAALDILGDIDIRIKIALEDWTPAVSAGLAYRSTYVDPNRAWVFTLGTDGKLYFTWYPTGSNASAINKASSVATGLADGATAWVRVTLDVDNGAAGNDVKFYTSTDDAATWTQLGTTQTTAGVTSLPNVASSLPFAISAAGAFAGKFYRFIVKSGIDGTSVVDVSAASITAGNAASFTATTGQTVTINRATTGLKTVCVVSSCWLFATDDYISVADNPLLNFSASDSFTVCAVIRQWTNTPDFGGVISKDNGTTSWGLMNNPVDLATYGFIDDGPNAVNTGSYVNTATNGQVKVHGFIRDVANDGLYGVSGSTISAKTTDTTTGTLLNAAVTYIGYAAGGYNDMELIAIAVFRRVLTTAELTQIAAYYQARLS